MKFKTDNKVKKGFTPHHFLRKKFSPTKTTKSGERDLSSTTFREPKSGAGFTLIELLVVIAIIGILAGIVLVVLGGARDRAKDARIQADMAQFRTQGEIIFSSADNYDDVDCAVVGNIKTLCNDIISQGGIKPSDGSPGVDIATSGSPVDEYCADVELNSGQFWCVDSELNSVQGTCPDTAPFICVAGGGNGGGSAETPWQTNEYGILRTNIAWNYTMGYKFTPQVSGQITKLGGFFNGTKTVYLWDANQTLLTQTQVTSANTWSYTAITPVAVTAGSTYTIGVYLNGSGGSYRSSIALPQTYGNIKIDASCYRSGFNFPGTCQGNYMYGQVDIEFSTW